MTDTTTTRKRTKLLWIGGIALFVLLALAALFAPQPTDPTVVQFEQLALFHGLEPYDNPEGTRQFVNFKHPLTVQKALIRDYEARAVRSGLTERFAFSVNPEFMTAITQTPTEPRYEAHNQRWGSWGTLVVKLSCTGPRTVLEIEHHKPGIADRVRAGFRRLTGRP
jgi:hypothetical protein